MQLVKHGFGKGVAVLASSSSSEGKSPSSGSIGSSSIGFGANGREGGDETSWVGGWMGSGDVICRHFFVFGIRLDDDGGILEEEG